MTSQLIEPGINIFDMVVNQYGTIETLFDVVKLNGWGVTEELAPGQLVMIDDTLKVAIGIVEMPTAPSAPFDSAIVEPGQNTFDMAVQLYGGIEGLFDMATKNGLSITDDINSGTQVLANAPIDKNMRAILKSLEIKPATAVNAEEAAVITPEGIDYWAIEVDFIIS